MTIRAAVGPLVRNLVNCAARPGLQHCCNVASRSRQLSAETPSQVSTPQPPSTISPSTTTEESPQPTFAAAAPVYPVIPLANSNLCVPAIPEHITAPTVATTIYHFPTMEPLRLTSYPSAHLMLPLRHDILHRAIVYEGDRTRQGTASTKWRDQVHGSGRKIRPQKGTGHARLGDRKSPMLRGGGVAFGPHPRNFATGLPRKIYDRAWRTALSYRYRRGELILVDDGAELDSDNPHYLGAVFDRNGWGRVAGRSLVVTTSPRKNLWAAIRGAGQHGVVKTWHQVDVKNLLEMGRLIVEKTALDVILERHQSDLKRPTHTIAQP